MVMNNESHIVDVTHIINIKEKIVQQNSSNLSYSESEIKNVSWLRIGKLA